MWRGPQFVHGVTKLDVPSPRSRAQRLEHRALAEPRDWCARPSPVLCTLGRGWGMGGIGFAGVLRCVVHTPCSIAHARNAPGACFTPCPRRKGAPTHMCITNLLYVSCDLLTSYC